MIYEIAGLKVEMSPRYGRLTRQSASYASSGTPVIRVKPEPEDEAYVAMDCPSEEEREYICCSAAFCRSMIGHGRFFLHASAVVHDGAAYLFSGPSGTGKSTHTALWRELYPGSYILNDDKPVLWPGKAGITVWGTPFSGKSDLQVNQGVPLKGICFLTQGKENLIQRMPEDQALVSLLQNTWRPRDHRGMTLLLDMIEQVLTGSNLFLMQATAAPEAARLSYRVMKGL